MQVEEVGEAGPVVPRITSDRSLPTGRSRAPRPTMRCASTRRHPLTYITRVRRPGRGTPGSSGGDYIAHLKQDGRARRDVHPHPRGVFAGGLDGSVDRGVGQPRRTPHPRLRRTPRPRQPSDYKACVAFDTGGLGDKGFNDLAMKGLEDAKALGYDDRLLRGAGRDRLRGQHPAPHRRGLPDDRHGRLQPGAGHDRRDPRQPGRQLRPGRRDLERGRRRTSRWARPTTCRSRRTSPAWTSRSMRPGMLAGYLAAGFSKSGKIGTYGGQQFPGVTRFMDGLYAGIKYYNEKNGTTVEPARVGRRHAERHVRRRGQPVGRPGQGRAARPDLPRPGCGHRPSGRRWRPATVRSRR